MRAKFESELHEHTEVEECAVCAAIAAKKEEEERSKQVNEMLGREGGHAGDGTGTWTSRGGEVLVSDYVVDPETGMPGPLGVVTLDPGA